MERQTSLAETIDTVANKAKYDNCAKKLLAFKAIDAIILKHCTKEFSGFSVDYICKHCLSGDVEISERAVHQDQLNQSQRINGDEQVTKMNSESSSINEGTVYFDVRFNAVLPGNKEPITLIINLEIQTVDKPGYELVTRGIYYCARMISEQHGTVFTNEHYEKIQKVYSMWICPSTAQCRQNGMFRYHTIEESVFGDSHVEKENYDLMEVVILNLGEADSDADGGILDFLNMLFSSKVTPDEKKRILNEKYNIAMTEELESEVRHMCNLSTAIEEQAEMKKAKETAINLHNMGMDDDFIAKAVNISVDIIKQWLAPASA